MIHRKLYKKLNLTIRQNGICTKKEYVPENEIQNSLGYWDTNGLPDLGQMTTPNDDSPQTQKRKKEKRTWRTMVFEVSADHRVKIKGNEKRVNYLDLAREPWRLCNMRGAMIPIVIGKRTGRVVNPRTNREYPNNSIIKNGLNTEKSPGAWIILAVTHIWVKYHNLKQLWRVHKEWKSNEKEQRTLI